MSQISDKKVPKRRVKTGRGRNENQDEDVNKDGGPISNFEVISNSCGICNENVKDDERAMECEMCEVRFHIVCEKMPGVVYDYIVSVDQQFSWYCTSCQKGCVKLHKSVKELRKQTGIISNKQTVLEEKVNVLAEVVVENQEASKATEARLGTLEAKAVNVEDKIDNNNEKQMIMENMLGNLEAKFAAWEEKLSPGADSNINYADIVKNEAVPALQSIMREEIEQFKKNMEDNDKRQRGEYEQQVQELKDEETRKNNIIIYGVPESKEKDGAKRKEDDQKFIMETIENKMEIEISQNSLTKLFRLGKIETNEEKPRPLLVGFNLHSIKRDILAQTKKLRDFVEYKDVHFNHDLTKAQREKARTLVIEAKQQEANDKSGNFVYRVRGPPDKLVVKKIRKIN